MPTPTLWVYCETRDQVNQALVLGVEAMVLVHGALSISAFEPATINDTDCHILGELIAYIHAQSTKPIALSILLDTRFFDRDIPRIRNLLHLLEPYPDMALRITDPGLLTYVQTHFTNRYCTYVPYTGTTNFGSIHAMAQLANAQQLSTELTHTDWQLIRNQFADYPLEGYFHGSHPPQLPPPASRHGYV